MGFRTKKTPAPRTKARGDFALPGGRFPLNTPGRIKAAPGLARYSEAKGNITAAQAEEVARKAAAKRAK